jgi:cbb3-type cytochrome oxidase subunit 3
MEKVIEFLKKNWVIVLIGIVIIYILYKNKKNNELARRLEDNRQQALIEFDKFNVLSSAEKKDKAYEEEKKSLIDLVKNTTEKERQLLFELLSGAVSVFQKSYKGETQEEAAKNFQQELDKFHMGLASKYGKENVIKFKAKMDKYGCDM